MTAAIIHVLHLKTGCICLYLPIPEASLHFRQCDVCGNIMGALILHWVRYRI